MEDTGAQIGFSLGHLLSAVLPAAFFDGVYNAELFAVQLRSTFFFGLVQVLSRET
jgi:hypothetical protein